MGDERNITRYTRYLIKNYMKYFGRRGVLNSDGMRLLNELVREVMKNRPELGRLIKDVRRDPTLSNFMKFAEAVLGSEAWTLLRNTIYGT